MSYHYLFFWGNITNYHYHYQFFAFEFQNSKKIGEMSKKKKVNKWVVFSLCEFEIQN
jgi:hypothetical protein